MITIFQSSLSPRFIIILSINVSVYSDNEYLFALMKKQQRIEAENYFKKLYIHRRTGNQSRTF